MNDTQIEQEIKDKGLNVAPRVQKERIDALMDRVVYHFDQPEGTTSTLAHAFLDGTFLLATGHSACVCRENFNAESGRKWAQDKAEALARDKLWELEGYALRQAMTDGALRIEFKPFSLPMAFGDALEALKAGHRVARKGWNGKGMWLALSGALEGREIPAGQFWNAHNAVHAHAQGGTAKVLPCITMKTADNAILMGWLASQTDMLAEDWAIVPIA